MLKPFPHFLQLDAMDCGPTCLRMIAKYYGRNYTLQFLRERLFITREGVSMIVAGKFSSSFSARLLVFFFIFLLSCKSHEIKKDDITKIDILKEEKSTYLNASEVISKIEYIKLETSSQCLIGDYPHISISENYILVFNCYSSPDCYLFSRKGEFIRRIGQRGNGPNDYKDDIYSVKIDEKSGVVFLMSFSEILEYRLTGEFVKRLNIREFIKTVGISIPNNITHWKDEFFCSNFSLDSGKEPYRFIIFTLDGEIVKFFPNHVIFNYDNEGSKVMSSYNSEASIYCYNEQLFFKEILNDTLFRVTDQLELVPEIIFELPGKKIPINMRGKFAEISDNKIRPLNSPDFVIRKIYEVDNYLYFTGTEQLLFEKNTKRLISFDADPFLKREIVVSMPNVSTMTRTIQLSGFRNDIDGGLPFLPHYLSNVQNTNQLVCVYQSYVLKENLTEEHFARYKIKHEEAHKRLKNLLANLDWEDNPVLMIATFK